MDAEKIGRLIARLRKEKGLTQQSIAEALNISNKTVSKWECGLGCPDVSLWPDLSAILRADLAQLMEGEIILNRPDTGKMDKICFYVCPACKNILTSTGGTSIVCCGRKLEQLMPRRDENTPVITAETIDTDYFIAIDHEMTREHYLLFAAYVKDDKAFMIRLYPEQSATVRIPYMAGGKLFLYCVKHGLTVWSQLQ